MSTITVTNIKATGETASRSAASVAAAWVHGDMTGTAAIQDSFNFSSLTDNGTGNMSVTFTDNMANANWIFTTCFNNNAADQGANLKSNSGTLSTSVLSVTKYENNSATDCTLFGCAVHGDLA